MNMEQEQLLEFVKGIRRDKSAIISPETLLFKERLLDSMNILDLMGYIEKRLERKLKDEEIIMSNFESVEKIVKTFSKI